MEKKISKVRRLNETTASNNKKACFKFDPNQHDSWFFSAEAKRKPSIISIRHFSGFLEFDVLGTDYDTKSHPQTNYKLRITLKNYETFRKELTFISLTSMLDLHKHIKY
ncbi:hypothetical protein BpHYR1_017237 [Brachionus plicatilis]|uniref:Uncharacterized protein n=1 Tax=Brachionus plicatilis TaxID=10195 RepID=A0A3M7SPZ8_BRAPC|nr:hypothetical protein BpHYR1_017237 [Brachionus plicatilis]